MVKTQFRKNFLKGLLICLSLLCTISTVGAQAGRDVVISNPETAQFPFITVYFDITDRDGRLVTDLLEDQVTLKEDETELTVLDFESLTPGIQLVTALNISPPFAIQDVSGKSRFNYITEALLNWANQSQADSPDDISLLSNDGLELTHTDDKDDFIAALEAYSPELRETEPNFNVLAKAIELASDPVDQLGMKRVVLLFTPPSPPDGSAAIESLISQAKDNQVIVIIILVSSPAFFESTGAELLKELSVETKGDFITYSDGQTLPDFESMFSPLRSTYLINYKSQIVTSGVHTLELSIGSDLGASLGQIEFILDVQPPNPIFISPPQVITRKGTQSGDETNSTVEFEPLSVNLNVIIEFPDGHPRDLEEVIFRVDGEVETRITTPPYSQVDWDLSQYQTSAVHYITIEAVDTLGLSRQSVQTPVHILIDVPPPTIRNIIGENAGAFAGLAFVLILGLVLFILISKGTIKPAFSFGGNRFFKKKGKQQKNNSQVRKVTQAKSSNTISGDLELQARQKSPWFRLIPISDVSQQQVTEPIQVYDQEVLLGNDPASEIISIQHPSVAKLHARISTQPDGDHTIKDEGSAAGTWINYKQILSTKPQSLKDGDIIHIGEAGFRYQLMDG